METNKAPKWNDSTVLHTAKRTLRFPEMGLATKDVGRVIREYAARDGWAYATDRSGPETRVVVASTVAAHPVGATHMDLSVYNVPEVK